MRLKIDPPTLRDDLLEFPRGSGCLALMEGSNAIETDLLNRVSDRHDRAILAGLVESWRARHPEARVEVVSLLVKASETRLSAGRECWPSGRTCAPGYPCPTGRPPARTASMHPDAGAR
jgi:hypothetical protein